MKKGTLVWLIVATALVLVGAIIFGGTMFMIKWDFLKLSTVKYRTNIYEIDEEISSVSLYADTAHISFARSESDSCKVECYEEDKLYHDVYVEDGTLVIKRVDTRKWYNKISVSFDTTKIKVYLPESEYERLFIESHTGDIEIKNSFSFESVEVSLSTGDVTSSASASGKMKIKTSTGDVTLENVCAGELDVSTSTGGISLRDISCSGDVKTSVSTGKMHMANVRCKNFESVGSTGDITLDSVIATEGISVRRSTGDVRFEKSDASNVFITTTTGSVKGSLLTEKVFLTKTDTGKIDIPTSAGTGRCDVSTDTGDIKITVG